MKKKFEEDLGSEAYENLIRQPLQLLRICFVVYSAFIFLTPVYKGGGIGIDSISSFICWVVVLGSLLSCHGMLFDFTAMFPVVVLRSVFFIYAFFFKWEELNLITFLILMVVEIVINMLILSDKDNYEYVKEEEIGDEFY